MESKIEIRPARQEDIAVIARAVAMAIGDEQTLQAYCGEAYLAVFEKIVAHPHTQYSWQRALVAEVEGRVAGAVVGYDGAQLHTLRAGTWAILRNEAGIEPNLSDETEAGEYYLDSVGVEPPFRGLGVGRALVLALCERAYAEGHERVGLIVDYANLQAERLYSALGFERVGSRHFFGHPMWHLQRVRPANESPTWGSGH